MKKLTINYRLIIGVLFLMFTTMSCTTGNDALIEQYDYSLELYVEMLQQAMDGDISDMASWESKCEEIEDVRDKMEIAKPNFSPEQLKRCEEIDIKYMIIALEIANQELEKSMIE